jgi:hypothetical protein
LRLWVKLHMHLLLLLLLLHPLLLHLLQQGLELLLLLLRLLLCLRLLKQKQSGLHLGSKPRRCRLRLERVWLCVTSIAVVDLRGQHRLLRCVVRSCSRFGRGKVSCAVHAVSSCVQEQRTVACQHM